MIENLPQYLDTEYEFYLDQDSDLLYYRPPNGMDPNEMQLEMVVNEGHITFEDQQHVEVSGLSFRYADVESIRFQGDCRHISIRNCKFENLLKHAIVNEMKPDYKKWERRYKSHPHILEQWKLERQDHLTVADCEFAYIADRVIMLGDELKAATSYPWGTLGRVDILRNKLEMVGIRHQGNKYSSISSISIGLSETGMIAGNVVKRSFGPGIQYHGGMTNGSDIELIIRDFITGKGQRSWKVWENRPKELWKAPEPEGGYDKKMNPVYGGKQVAKYPGERRHTLISRTRNLLVEVKFKTQPGHAGGALLSKHDGESGYSLLIKASGEAEFRVGAANDGDWHHVIAEIDRKSGRMTIYLDGKIAGQAKASFGEKASIDCKADFTVGKFSGGERGFFVGAIDFMRVCHGTLADARTSIEELYAWQYTDGPALFDMRGRKPMGKRRDAGALELK